MTLAPAGRGGELAVKLAFADPLRARVAIEDVQPHVGDGGDVGEHAGVRAPHRVVDAGERVPAPREPDEYRLADEQRAPASPTGALPPRSKPACRA